MGTPSRASMVKFTVLIELIQSYGEIVNRVFGGVRHRDLRERSQFEAGSSAGRGEGRFGREHGRRVWSALRERSQFGGRGFYIIGFREGSRFPEAFETGER